MLRHLHCLVYKHFKITSEVNYTYGSISRSHVTALAPNRSLCIYLTLTAAGWDSTTCTGSGLHFSCIAEAPGCKRLFCGPGSWFTAEPHHLGSVPRGKHCHLYESLDMMSEMGCDKKEESGIGRNNAGSASVTALSSEHIKTFLSRLYQWHIKETFSHWRMCCAEQLP